MPKYRSHYCIKCRVYLANIQEAAQHILDGHPVYSEPSDERRAA